MVLEIGLRPLSDLDRVLRTRVLVIVDLLNRRRTRPGPFEMLAESLVGGGPHQAQLPTLQRRLEAGFEAIQSPPPEVAPAPITVWISSDEHTASGWIPLVDERP